MVDTDKCFMGIIAATLIALGISLCFFCTPAILCTIGGVLIIGGVNSAFAVYQNCDWKEFGLAVAAGIICGIVSCVVSPIIFSLAGKLAAMLGKPILGYFTHTFFMCFAHAGLSALTNVNEKKIFTNLKKAILAGILIGGISSAIYLISNGIGVDVILEKLENILNSYRNELWVIEYSQKFIEFVPTLFNRIDDPNVQMGVAAAWKIIQTYEPLRVAEFILKHNSFFGNFFIGAGTQYLMNGEINWFIAIGQAAVYGFANRSLASRGLSKHDIKQVPSGTFYTPSRNDRHLRNDRNVDDNENNDDTNHQNNNLVEHSNSNDQTSNNSGAPPHDATAFPSTGEKITLPIPNIPATEYSINESTLPTIITKTNLPSNAILNIQPAPHGEKNPQPSAAPSTCCVQENKMEYISSSEDDEILGDIVTPISYGRKGDDSNVEGERQNKQKIYLDNAKINERKFSPNMREDDKDVIDNIVTEINEFNKFCAQKEELKLQQISESANVEILQYNSIEQNQRLSVSLQNRKSLFVKNATGESPQKHKPPKAKASKTSANLDHTNSKSLGFQKKIVSIIPLILYDEKYKLFDPKSWPIFPKDGVKVVTVSGIKASGRTTFIHALAYSLGYSLTSAQAFMSRYSIGVFMYLFAEDNLLVLDCADGMGKYNANDNNIFPSALVLELFCYLISDHRIHHVSINSDMTSELLESNVKQCEATMKILYRGGCSVQLRGGRIATLLFRYSKEFEEIHYNKMQSKHKEITKHRIENFKRSFKYLGDEKNYVDQNGYVIENKKMKVNAQFCDDAEECCCDLDIHKMPLLPIDYNANQKEIYDSEISKIVDMIKRCTPIHHTFEKLAEHLQNDQPTFKELVCEVWRRICENDDLFKTTSNAINQNIVNESGDQHIQQYLEKVKANFGNVKGVQTAFEWISEMSQQKEDEIKTTSKDNTLFVIRGIAKVIEAIFEDRNSGLPAYFDECVTTGFEGLLIFYRKNEKKLEFIATKAVIEETKILEIIVENKIIYNYSDSWAYFSYLAYYLFRIELFNLNIVEKAIQVLQSNGNGTETHLLKSHIYSTLGMLMCADMNCVFGQGVPETQNKAIIDEEDLIEIFYNFEKGAETFNSRFCSSKTFESRKETHHAYHEMMKFPRNYFNGLEYAKCRKITFDDLDPPIIHKFEYTMHKVLYNVMGYHTAKKVIENFKEFMPSYENFNHKHTVAMQKNALEMWSWMGNLSLTFEDLLPQMLLKTTIKKWLMSYVKCHEHPNITSILQLCNILIYAESVHDYVPLPLKHRSNNQDMRQILAQEKRTMLAKHYRNIGLKIVEKTNISDTLTRFCKKGFDNSMLQSAEIWISHFEKLLKRGIGRDDKTKCLHVFINYRKKLINKCFILSQLAETVLYDSSKSDDKDSTSPTAISTALKLLFVIPQFLNKFMCLYKVEMKTNFCLSNDDINPTETQIWINLTKIYGILAKYILFHGADYQLKTNFDLNVYEHGLLHVLCYIYNLSLLSNISHTSSPTIVNHHVALGELKINNTAKLIRSINDFCDLDISDPDTNDSQIIKSAVKIWKDYGNPDDTVKEFCDGILKNAYERSIIRWKNKERKNRQIENLKKGHANSNDDEEEKIASYQVTKNFVQPKCVDEAIKYLTLAGNKEAIKDFIVSVHGHLHFEGWRFSAKNYEISLFNALKKNYGNAKALALVFVFCNPKSLGEKVTWIFNNHFQHILGNQPIDESSRVLILRSKTNRKLNSKVNELFKLKFIFEIFTAFGYEKSETVKDGIKLQATAASINEHLPEIEEFVELAKSLESSIGELAIKVCSEFTVIEKLATNIEDEVKVFEYLTLPKVFVSNSQHGILSWKIKDLRQEYSRNNATLPYSLIRIHLEDDRILQAVFVAGATVECIANVFSTFLGMKEDKIKILDMKNAGIKKHQTLSSIGLIPGGYLKAILKL